MRDLLQFSIKSITFTHISHFATQLHPNKLTWNTGTHNRLENRILQLHIILLKTCNFIISHNYLRMCTWMLTSIVVATLAMMLVSESFFSSIFSHLCLNTLRMICRVHHLLISTSSSAYWLSSYLNYEALLKMLSKT